ncbi:MAG: ATP-binding cassette domain-containing protein [Flavipsychrobacter sp.]|nr:ATP-binding cassette domain-containing protein [Flavipsychrobacter sp.]
MRLSIEHIVPIPMKDRISEYNSRVWNQKLTFNSGERIFIQAPSGTGKTTLIHFLYGLRNDYEGKIHWSAFKMHEINTEQLSQLRASAVSVIFQDMRLFPELTTWENLEVKRRLTNTVSEYDAEKWMDRLGIKHKMDSTASKLSYGEQQRVAIVRALLQPFEWLIMDEPFSHLDHANRQRAIALINEVAEMNKAGILLADLDDNNYFTYTRKLLL